MRDERAVAGKIHEHLHGCLFVGRAGDIAVAYAGELCDVRRDVHLWVNKGVEFLYHVPAGEYDRADLRHAVVHGVEPRRLYVERHKLRIYREARFADNGAVAVHIVEIIRFKAVNYLHALFFARLPHIRERLRHAVIRHGDGGHAPVRRALDDGGGIGERVHCGKAGVQMQLHALCRRIVGADHLLCAHDIARIHNKVVVILGVYYLALHDQMIALSDGGDDLFVLISAEIARHAHGVCAVGHVEAEHAAAVLQRAARHGENIALYHYPPGFQCDRAHGDAALLHPPAVEHVPHGGAAGRLGRGCCCPLRGGLDCCGRGCRLGGCARRVYHGGGKPEHAAYTLAHLHILRRGRQRGKVRGYGHAFCFRLYAHIRHICLVQSPSAA